MDLNFLFVGGIYFYVFQTINCRRNYMQGNQKWLTVQQKVKNR